MKAIFFAGFLASISIGGVCAYAWVLKNPTSPKTVSCGIVGIVVENDIPYAALQCGDSAGMVLISALRRVQEDKAYEKKQKLAQVNFLDLDLKNQKVYVNGEMQEGESVLLFGLPKGVEIAPAPSHKGIEGMI